MNDGVDENWVAEQLELLLGFSSEDVVGHILSFQNRKELRKYLKEFLGETEGSERFAKELCDRMFSNGGSSSFGSLASNKDKEGGQKNLQRSQKPAPHHESKGKKQGKFVKLDSLQGQTLLNQMPQRTKCDCQAILHSLINNCLECGKIVCAQEGYGPCLFCGAFVFTKEQQQILQKNSKKSAQIYTKLMREFSLVEESEEAIPLEPPILGDGKQASQEAFQHKDRLLLYDRESVARSRVIDDQSDYYSYEKNKWLSQEQKVALKAKEEELREKRSHQQKECKVTFDLELKKFVESPKDAVNIYDSGHVSSIHNMDSGELAIHSSLCLLPEDLPFDPPVYIASNSDSITAPVASHPKSSHQDSISSLVIPRLQHESLLEMQDSGMCLSMHQPYASLLVHGIKQCEGRTWYTPHRGRLWIASTCQKPTADSIAKVEDFYRQFYAKEGGGALLFPRSYPQSCLLGCVQMEDCLSQDEYISLVKENQKAVESESPYVFVCSNPQFLERPFSCSGDHKLFKLDSSLHLAAKNALLSSNGPLE